MMDPIDARLDSIDGHLGAIDGRLRSVEADLAAIKERLGHLPTKGYIVPTLLGASVLFSAVALFADRLLVLIASPKG